MDTAQWAQGIGVVKPMESGSKVSSSSSSMLERRARPVKDQALNCPRCNSTNTKFCYYNNYSLSQPRYFCKTCRRYWTEGGSLRNVPVGGGSRKNKRSTPSSSSSTTTTTSLTSTLPSSKKLLPDLITATPPTQQQSTTSFPHHQSASQNPKIHQGQDLNLAYPPPPSNNTHDDYSSNNSNINITSSNSSAMELLKTGIASRGLNSFMPMSLSDSTNTMYSSAGLIPMQEFKPAGLNFSLEGFENGYGTALQGIHHHHHQEGSAGARVLFPVEDLKQHQVQSNHHHAEFVEQNKSHQGDSTGYWNGMLGGGSW